MRGGNDLHIDTCVRCGAAVNLDLKPSVNKAEGVGLKKWSPLGKRVLKVAPLGQHVAQCHLPSMREALNSSCSSMCVVGGCVRVCTHACVRVWCVCMCVCACVRVCMHVFLS